MRQAQYGLCETAALDIARGCVAAKIRNSRHGLLRSARDIKSEEDRQALREYARQMARFLTLLPGVMTLDVLRGKEGDAARTYFSAMNCRLSPGVKDAFAMNGRSRRPPLDRMNALISFLYTLLTHDCRSALESVGLDPQYGYLHTLRPGRPSLALDLMEELRPVLADRLALALVNRQQLKADDFTMRPGGAVEMSDEARKTLLVAYQERKQEVIQHPLLEQEVPYGVLPFIQARLMARTIRGDMEHYIPYFIR